MPIWMKIHLTELLVYVRSYFEHAPVKAAQEEKSGNRLASFAKIHTGANAGTYCPNCDGNVSECLGSNGTVAAHYDYDPFGNLTKTTGAMADTFSHRFSTKPRPRNRLLTLIILGRI